MELPADDGGAEDRARARRRLHGGAEAAEQTSLTVLRLGDLIAEAGFPAGVVNIVTGMGETAGDRMVRHPDVDKVAFTGSTEVGKIINRAATDTLKRVTLELGGKSPVIVLPDVDIAAAGAGAARSIFANAGQVCIAGSRLYAHRSIFDELLEGVAAAAGQFKVGPSLAPDTVMGRSSQPNSTNACAAISRRGARRARPCSTAATRRKATAISSTRRSWST
jgi:acyl-CoA reductase-like NAD-dependent aldehyde dehydrogenase